MAFDGVAISCLKYELQSLLKDGRVDKIAQPEKDEISIVIRAGGKNQRLLISASSSSPRIHLTSNQKDNPEKAPMFCMLLRKHLSSGKIVDFSQPEFERVLKIHIESRDELGDLSIKTLIVEIMGRHSNIILVDSEDKILGSIKHVDFTVSSVRQVLPGMRYEMPPSQNKLNPMETVAGDILPDMRTSVQTADKFLLETFTGIGPLTAREIAYLSLRDHSADLSTISDLKKELFARFVASYFDNIKKCNYSPVLLYKNEKKVWDFNALDITQYEGKVIVKKRDSLNEALDEFYTTRDSQERISQKTAGLLKFVDNNIQRCQKKLSLQNQKLKDCEDKEKDKIYGDLIISNLYQIEESQKNVEVENYYNNMEKVKINLKPELTPSQNAQRYYTLYQKAKNAEKMTAEQVVLSKQELDYLDSVQDSLLRSESEKDINEIRDELYSQGYSVKKKTTSKIRKAVITQPLKFVIGEGDEAYEVYVGKNNIQNDTLTLRSSKPNDLWFHVKNIPGSHTVIKTDGKIPSDDIIVQAAKICAYFSKAKNSANVPVDYTIIKNVKKPSGAKPGMVIYDNYNTVNVIPTPPPENN